MSSSALALLFAAVSLRFGLPPGLLSAVCFTESGHRPAAVHHDDGGEDSVGICQIHASTAKRFGFTGSRKDLLNPVTNIHYAAAYLGWQEKRYHGDVIKAVAAYNTGTHRVNSEGITVNRGYVRKVLRAWTEHR